MASAQGKKTNAAEVQYSQVKAHSDPELFHKVKIEKLLENKTAREMAPKGEGKRNMARDDRMVSFKKGMEVVLTSPNSAQLVAYVTVHNVDKDAKCMDGKPLSDYVEVLVNIVLKETIVLPRAHGRITKMGNAAAHCIAWPRQNLAESEAESTVVQHKEKS